MAGAGGGVSPAWYHKLMQEAIAEKAEKSVDERLSRAYDMLAGDAAETDVEKLFAIQAEALLDG